MNRRSFLAAMLAAGAAPYVMSGGIGRGVLMPVREIWTPNMLPAYVRDVFTEDGYQRMITAEALRILESKIKFAERVNALAMMDIPREFGGATVHIRRPLRQRVTG